MLDKPDVMIYAINTLEEDHHLYGKRYTYKQLSDLLGLKITTLYSYINRLKKKGSIDNIISEKTGTKTKMFRLKGKGKKEYENIQIKIKDTFLEPEKYNLPYGVGLEDILTKIKDNGERIFFLSMLSNDKAFDISLFFRMMKVKNRESIIPEVLDELLPAGDQISPMNLSESLMKMTLFGHIERENIDVSQLKQNELDAMIAIGELERRQGHIEESRRIFNRILESKVKISSDKLLIIKINIALCRRKSDEPKKALEMLKDLLKETKNSVHKGRIKQFIAAIYSDLSQYDNAARYYTSSIGIFRHIGSPILLCLAQNAQGVNFFRMGHNDMAEKVWLKAKKEALEAKSYYALAILLPNLADISLLKGDFRAAEKHLQRAERIFNKVNDLEGLAVVEFNWALLYARKKEFERAVDHFNESERIAFPLPSSLDRAERKDVFSTRMIENGCNSIIS